MHDQLIKLGGIIISMYNGIKIAVVVYSVHVYDYDLGEWSHVYYYVVVHVHVCRCFSSNCVGDAAPKRSNEWFCANYQTL